MNIRPCKQCGKEVDFDEPYCAHETMEESAWLNMPGKPQDPVIDAGPLAPLAEELGLRAAAAYDQMWENAFNGNNTLWGVGGIESFPEGDTP